MINLLPDFQKEELRQRENLILFLNLALSFLFFLISLLLLLLAINFYFLGELKTQKEILNLEKGSVNLELEKEILRNNQFFSQLISFEKEKKEVFPILEKIFENLPQGIKLKNVSVSKNKGLSISLIGLASKRDDLIALKNYLEKNFSKVAFPTQVWLKEKDIDFSVNFELE